MSRPASAGRRHVLDGLAARYSRRPRAGPSGRRCSPQPAPGAASPVQLRGGGQREQHPLRRRVALGLAGPGTGRPRIAAMPGRGTTPPVAGHCGGSPGRSRPPGGRISAGRQSRFAWEAATAGRRHVCLGGQPGRGRGWRHRRPDADLFSAARVVAYRACRWEHGRNGRGGVAYDGLELLARGFARLADPAGGPGAGTGGSSSRSCLPRSASVLRRAHVRAANADLAHCPPRFPRVSA